MKLVYYFLVIYVSVITSARRPTQHVCRTDPSRFWGPYLQQVTEPFEMLEGPFWNPENNLLYCVNLHQGEIISFNPTNQQVNSVKLANGDVTLVLPTKTPNRFVVGLNRSLVLLTWDGKTNSQGKYEVLTNVDEGKDGNRFNDGKTDANGRVWAGTMGYEGPNGVVPDQGSLYKFEIINKKVVTTTEISPVSISNGLAWTKDHKKFFYIDTPTRKIVSYDFNATEGNISNKQIVFDLDKHDVDGFPDGMTIDNDDNLFIALFNGGAVIKVNPKDSTLLQKIAIPAQKVTSVMFGGPELDILFVTTSRFGSTQDQLKSQPAAGSLFAITNLGVTGRRMTLANF